jgi:hypothetical protein
MILIIENETRCDSLFIITQISQNVASWNKAQILPRFVGRNWQHDNSNFCESKNQNVGCNTKYGDVESVL